MSIRLAFLVLALAPAWPTLAGAGGPRHRRPAQAKQAKQPRRAAQAKVKPPRPKRQGRRSGGNRARAPGRFTCPTSTTSNKGVLTPVGPWRRGNSLGQFTGRVTNIPAWANGASGGIFCGLPESFQPAVLKISTGFTLSCFYGAPPLCGGRSAAGMLQRKVSAKTCRWNVASRRFDCILK